MIRNFQLPFGVKTATSQLIVIDRLSLMIDCCHNLILVRMAFFVHVYRSDLFNGYRGKPLNNFCNLTLDKLLSVSKFISMN